MWCSNCRSYFCRCETPTLGTFNSCHIKCTACHCNPCEFCSFCGCCATCKCNPKMCDCEMCGCCETSFFNMAKEKCRYFEWIISEYDVISRQVDQRKNLMSNICLDVARLVNELICLFTGQNMNKEQICELLCSIELFYKGDRSNFHFCLGRCPTLFVWVQRHENNIGFYLISKSGVTKIAADSGSDAEKAVKKPVGFKKLPKGWTAKSFKKFYNSITKEDPDHPFSACVAKLKDKFDSPERFCSKMLDQFFKTTKWRNKKVREKLEKKLGIFNPNAGPPKIPVK